MLGTGRRVGDEATSVTLPSPLDLEDVQGVGLDGRGGRELLRHDLEELARRVEGELVAPRLAPRRVVEDHLLDLDRRGRVGGQVVDRDARVAGVAGVKPAGVLVEQEPADARARVGDRPEVMKAAEDVVAVDPDPVDRDEPNVKQGAGRVDRQAERPGRGAGVGELGGGGRQHGADGKLPRWQDRERSERPAEEISAEGKPAQRRNEDLRRVGPVLIVHRRPRDRCQAPVGPDAERGVVRQHPGRLARVLGLVDDAEDGPRQAEADRVRPAGGEGRARHRRQGPAVGDPEDGDRVRPAVDGEEEGMRGVGDDRPVRVVRPELRGRADARARRCRTATPPAGRGCHRPGGCKRGSRCRPGRCSRRRPRS